MNCNCTFAMSNVFIFPFSTVNIQHDQTLLTRFAYCGLVMLDFNFPDSKSHGGNMGPIWGRQDSGGPHVGPMNFAIWVYASWFRVVESSEHIFVSAPFDQPST